MSDQAKKTARPGAGIRVSPDRLQPLGVIGSCFGVALAVFAAIPVWVIVSASELAGAVLVHPKVVLLVHLYALGFGGFVALGALRQLAPVVFQTAARDDARLFLACLGGMLAGFVCFVYGIAVYRYAVAAAGGAFMTTAFLLNFAALAAAAGRQSRRSVIQWYVLPAALSLVGTGVLGTLAAWHKATGLLGEASAAVLGSHLYLGPLGFYGFLITGVSYELAPFFGLTRVGSEKGIGRYDRAVLGLLLAGFALGWGGALAGSHRPYFLLPAALGLLLFVFDLRGIFRRRDPIRHTATLTGVRASHGYLLAAAAMIAAGSFFPALWASAAWIRAFGWLVAAGWLANAVIGYLHRILPFVVWHNRYWGKAKEEIRTPFQHMVSQKLGRSGFYVYNAGVLAVLVGFESSAAVIAAACLMAAGAWTLAFNLIRALFR